MAFQRHFEGTCGCMDLKSQLQTILGETNWLQSHINGRGKVLIISVGNCSDSRRWICSAKYRLSMLHKTSNSHVLTIQLRKCIVWTIKEWRQHNQGNKNQRWGSAPSACRTCWKKRASIHWKIVTSALACSATWRLTMTSAQGSKGRRPCLSHGYAWISTPIQGLTRLRVENANLREFDS